MTAARGRATRRPVQKRGIETCQKILKAARELFEEKGYHHTNTREIAARAGVAVGTFYGYYKEKKTLFLEVLGLYYEETAATALTVSAEDLRQLTDPHVVVRTIIGRLYEAHQIDPAFHREVLLMIYADHDVAAFVHEREEAVIERLIALFALVRDQLTVENPEVAARLVHRAAEEVIHQLRIFGSPLSEEQLLEALSTMLFKYLFT